MCSVYYICKAHENGTSLLCNFTPDLCCYENRGSTKLSYENQHYYVLMSVYCSAKFVLTSFLCNNFYIKVIISWLVLHKNLNFKKIVFVHQILSKIG